MIDFYKKADKKRREGELDFVPDRIEEKVMLLLFPKKKKKTVTRKVAPIIRETVRETHISPRRAFFDAYYECV